jgi:hypothetical protein
LPLPGPKYAAFDLHAGSDLAAASKGLAPAMTTFEGVVMVADVTGFTALTEARAAHKRLLQTC